MEIEINGSPVAVRVDPAMPLLWVLRDIVGLTGTKFGCGTGACGACTVIVDGHAMRSCVVPVSAMAGRKVSTIEIPLRNRRAGSTVLSIPGSTDRSHRISDMRPEQQPDCWFPAG